MRPFIDSYELEEDADADDATSAEVAADAIFAVASPATSEAKEAAPDAAAMALPAAGVAGGTIPAAEYAADMMEFD